MLLFFVLATSLKKSFRLPNEHVVLLPLFVNDNVNLGSNMSTTAISSVPFVTHWANPLVELGTIYARLQTGKIRLRDVAAKTATQTAVEAINTVASLFANVTLADQATMKREWKVLADAAWHSALFATLTPVQREAICRVRVVLERNPLIRVAIRIQHLFYRVYDRLTGLQGLNDTSHLFMTNVLFTVEETLRKEYNKLCAAGETDPLIANELNSLIAFLEEGFQHGYSHAADVKRGKTLSLKTADLALTVPPECVDELKPIHGIFRSLCRTLEQGFSTQP
jgi:hypothetical protein